MDGVLLRYSYGLLVTHFTRACIERTSVGFNPHLLNFLSKEPRLVGIWHLKTSNSINIVFLLEYFVYSVPN